MSTRIRIGDRVQHRHGGEGIASGYVYQENTKSHNGEPRKRDAQAVEITWDATGMTTAEWKDDLIKVTRA